LLGCTRNTESSTKKYFAPNHQAKNTPKVIQLGHVAPSAIVLIAIVHIMDTDATG
jgi:hypothetical protein